MLKFSKDVLAKEIREEIKNLNKTPCLQNTKKSFSWALTCTVVFIYVSPVRTYKMAAALYCVPYTGQLRKFQGRPPAGNFHT